MSWGEPRGLQIHTEVPPSPTGAYGWDAEFTITGINPEPWTPGTITRQGKFSRMTKDGALLAYQNAIREWFWLNCDHLPLPPTCPVILEFEFWRQRVQYQAPSGRMVRKSACDVTNLQKALEDAISEGRRGKDTIPGILFKNDNQVVDIHSVMVEQGYETDPRIVIRIKYHQKES